MIDIPAELTDSLPEELMLWEPETVGLVLRSQFSEGKHLEVRERLIELVRQFDAMPFTCECEGCHQRLATRVGVIVDDGSIEENLLCSTCTMSDGGALSPPAENTGYIGRYTDLFDYLERVGAGGFGYVIIQSLARGKGFREEDMEAEHARLTGDQSKRFFLQSEVK